jgi:hypothetical protein
MPLKPSKSIPPSPLKSLRRPESADFSRVRNDAHIYLAVQYKMH